MKDLGLILRYAASIAWSALLSMWAAAPAIVVGAMLLLIGCASCTELKAETPDQLAARCVQLTLTAEVVAEPTWYVIDDNDVPYRIVCPSCPTGWRYGTWAEVRNQRGFWLQRRPDLVWSFANTDADGEIIQWVVYEKLGSKIIPNPRYRRAVREAVQQSSPQYIVPATVVPTTYAVPSFYRGWGQSGGGCASGRCGQ